MRQQSLKKSSKPELQNSQPRRPFRHTLWLLRALGVLLFSTSCLLMISLFVEQQILELYVSYLPQLLLVGAALFLLAVALSVRIALTFTFTKWVNQVGVIFVAIYIASVMLFVWASTISTLRQPVTAFANETDSSQVLSVATFNGLFTSTNFSGDIALLAVSDPDILILQEVDELDVRTAQLDLGYEFAFTTNCDCSAGETEVSIVSKYPILKADTIYENDSSTVLRAEVSITPEDEVIVYGVHMFVPYVAKAYDERAQAFDLLASSINAETSPVVVGGDFNTTIYSPQYEEFAADTEGVIQNITQRFWPRCSWYGVSEAGCLRLDYIFAPIGVDAFSLDIVEVEESDHRPVVVELNRSQLTR